MTKWVHESSEGSRERRDLLGGKGAGIAEMTRVLGSESVPAGFTITTEACVAYMRAGRTPPDGLEEQIDEALARLEHRAGKRLGDPADPLLVSVRSGAQESMPGMMDTVLNVGLTDQSVAGLAERTGDGRFAWDCYRRLVQMFGNVVRGIPGERFENAIAQNKRDRDVERDSELDAAALRELTEPTSSRSAPTTSRKPGSASLETTSRTGSSQAMSRRRSSRGRHSRRSTCQASAS